jgi:acyl-CoA synthetase (AMP-forming)/AMP-acid ligase II
MPPARQAVSTPLAFAKAMPSHCCFVTRQHLSAEIEQALVQFPGVRDCAVFGIPDGDLRETLMVVVEAAPDATISAYEICISRVPHRKVQDSA